MAKIEKDDEGDDMINVVEKVGVSGSNKRGDVMVVQAMLKYLTQRPQRWTSASIPEPNGVLDANTQKAIFDYQQYVRTNPLQARYYWIARDGSVSSYRKGVPLLHKQRLTITVMNGDCAMLSAGLRDGTDHIDAIVKRWPSTVGVALGRVNPLFL
jgi:hypothetical protein